MQKFDALGSFILAFGGFGTLDGQFCRPFALTTDSVGNVYVTDTNNQRIQVFDGNGMLLLKLGATDRIPSLLEGEFNFPSGVAVDAADHLLVAETRNDRVQRFDPGGLFVSKLGTHGQREGEFSNPGGVGVGPDGRLHAADSGNSRIQSFDTSGGFVSAFGEPGIFPGQLLFPSDVAVDVSGNFVVVDPQNDRIQVFDPAGGFLFAFGSQGAADGQFTTPTGLALTQDGAILVSDNA